MTVTTPIQMALSRYQEDIVAAMHQALRHVQSDGLPASAADLAAFYGQMQYHLGWVDENFRLINNNPGKLLRPTLLLLAYEAVGAWDSSPLDRALPAAAAIELTHNFSLIHDDIVDGDTERRHRPTLWSLWGHSQGVNTGDGMFALARLALWDVLRAGVDGEIAARLGGLLDQASLTIAEGQYLDLSFEQRTDVSVAMYLDMIGRKTAALMSAATAMGATLGTRDKTTIASLRTFGYEIGLAFQVRDDILGVWASTAELGKTPAGDIYRRKKALPALHALEHAGSADRQTLLDLYGRSTSLTADEVAAVLAIFARTETRTYCREYLNQQCMRARQVLDQVPHRTDEPAAARARADMETLVSFIERAGQA